MGVCALVYVMFEHRVDLKSHTGVGNLSRNILSVVEMLISSKVFAKAFYLPVF